MEPIALTDEQQDCVTSSAKVLRITGLPGTGKTFVLLRRAQHLAEQEAAKRSGARALVFCFNNTLAKYAHDLLVLNGVSSTVDTTTFHRWARGQLRACGVQHEVLDDQGQRAYLRQVLDACQRDNPESTLWRRRLTWWRDELHWIKTHLITSWDKYKVTRRTGRGSGLQEAARQTVWVVYTAYQHHLRQHRVMEFADFAPLLLHAWDEAPAAHPRVAHVLVDEAQDLGLAELRVLTRLRGDTLTAVADRRQKIYRTSFTWKDIGDDTRATFKVLTGSYRTTRPVAALARSLQRHEPLVRPGDEDYDSTDELPAKDGPLPVVLAVADAEHEQEVFLRLVQYLARVRGGRPIGVFARTWTAVQQAHATLTRQHIACEVIQAQQGSVVTPGVKLTTLHSAKGLEFADVVLLGLTEGLLPLPIAQEVARDEGESDEDFLSTERRLLYVAMTRTKHGLYLLHRPPASRFVAELDATRYATSVPDMPDLLTRRTPSAHSAQAATDAMFAASWP